MKKLTLLLICLTTCYLQGQSQFDKGMEKAFSVWESGDMNAAEQLFERIANAEPNEWLPNYYVAQINSLKSWEVKDINVLKPQLDKAQNYIDRAKAISPNNPEILVMQAHIYTNWVAYDGATYGMKYGGIVSGIYSKAYELAPENPRVVFNKAEWDMGSARYFGQDTTPYCKDIENSIELFANFKPESPFAPDWGLERAEQVLAECK
jgi:tetratricopeptide (TPR) repeat protein